MKHTSLEWVWRQSRHVELHHQVVSSRDFNSLHLSGIYEMILAAFSGCDAVAVVVVVEVFGVGNVLIT